MSYIYIKGNYGNGNVGDNAIAYCIYKKIYERGNKTYLLYNKYEKEYNDANKFYNILPYPVVPNNRFEKLYYILKYTLFGDTMIYGGGAQLNLKSELGLKNILKTIKIFKSKKNNKVCFFSIGIDGDYDKKVIKYILTEIVNFADYFSVRDNHSYEIIRSLNINKEVYLSSDPVVSYKILNECELNVTMEKMIDTIKIGIIPMGYKNLFLSLDRLINLLNEFNKNIEILITPFARGDTVSANNIIEYINNKYYGNKKLKIYKYNFTYNMDQIIMILTDVDYLITCRLHGGIIGALLYKPVLFCGNIEHLRYFHETLGFKNNNFIFDTKEIDNKIEYYIKYPANYICNHSCIEKAKNLLELDYDRLIKFLFYR